VSGESGDPTKFIDKVISACFTIFLGAMALYGAVKILSAVWVPLCIGSATLTGLVGVWFVIRRRSGW